MKLVSFASLTVLSVATLLAFTHGENYGAGGGYGYGSGGFSLVPAYGYGGYGYGGGGGIGGLGGLNDSWLRKFRLVCLLFAFFLKE